MIIGKVPYIERLYPKREIFILDISLLEDFHQCDLAGFLKMKEDFVVYNCLTPERLEKGVLEFEYHPNQ